MKRNGDSALLSTEEDIQGFTSRKIKKTDSAD
jgi:hypothetical protein